MHPIAKNHERERLIVSIQDARHNLAYWIRQASIRTDRESAAQASGLVSVWKTTLDANVTKLADLIAK